MVNPLLLADTSKAEKEMFGYCIQGMHQLNCEENLATNLGFAYNSEKLTILASVTGLSHFRVLCAHFNYVWEENVKAWVDLFCEGLLSSHEE